MVQLLVERGADVSRFCGASARSRWVGCTDFRDSRGWTPLLFALKEAPDSGAICDFLLAKGADPSVASFQKLSPLLTTVYAIEETQPVDGGSAKLAQLEKLLAKGAVDVEAHGYNPFFAGTARGRTICCWIDTPFFSVSIATIGVGETVSAVLDGRAAGSSGQHGNRRAPTRLPVATDDLAIGIRMRRGGVAVAGIGFAACAGATF